MTLGLLLGCLGWAALAQEPAAPPRTPRRVLVYTVSAGFEHEVVHRAAPEELSLVERTLVDLGKRTGDFEAVATRDAHEFNPTRLAQFDLVFFYTTGELPLSKRMKTSGVTASCWPTIHPTRRPLATVFEKLPSRSTPRPPASW